MKIEEAGKGYLRKCLAKLGNVKKLWPADYREPNELLAIVLLVIVLGVITALPSPDILRLVLGLPFALFLPGYTLLAALYVRRYRLDGPERLALSFGLSAAIVPLVGLILNFTFGISPASFFALLALFVLMLCLVAWVRRGRVPPAERFTLRLHLPRLSLNRKKAPAVLLGLAALAVVGSLSYVIVVPKSQEYFTEFYISQPENSSDYPVKLVAGVEQKMPVTIVNRERRAMDYLIEVKINGITKGRTGPLALAQGQQYEGEIGFTPEAPGERQLVEFVLYVEGVSGPYVEPLRLWVDVA
jgi:uncharacterized membrane protein